MKRIFFLAYAFTLAIISVAQPAARRNQPQRSATDNTLTTRAQISFPTAAPLEDDVVWRRDLYREIKLDDDANAGLYYPVEPVGSQMNLFTYIFKLMMSGPNRGGIAAYNYRMDGNEVFNDSARIKPLQFLDNYHIYYERTDRGIRLENSDIPSSEVKGYYLKESAYYDQRTSTFHRKVVALCPIMYREDDFGDGEVKYPLFWVRYDDLAPFLSKQIIMTSNLNNAATMSVDDYFTMNLYQGKIYKTTNLLGKTLAQSNASDSTMIKAQQKIENELAAFEKNIFGDPERKDSLDSIANAQDSLKQTKKASRSRRSGDSTTTVRRTRRQSTPRQSSSNGTARVSVRRERH